MAPIGTPIGEYAAEPAPSRRNASLQSTTGLNEERTLASIRDIKMISVEMILKALAYIPIAQHVGGFVYTRGNLFSSLEA
jgi:hypothetical protein